VAELTALGTSIRESQLSENQHYMDEYLEEILELFSEVAVAPPPLGPVKRCTKCGQDKELPLFGKRGAGLSAQCKPCVNTAQKARLASSDLARAGRKAAHDKWAQNNKDKIQAKQRRYLNTSNRRAAERRRVDPNFRIAGGLRNRINSALAGKIKSAPSSSCSGATSTTSARGSRPSSAP
jgi:hypothetical protein